MAKKEIRKPPSPCSTLTQGTVAGLSQAGPTTVLSCGDKQGFFLTPDNRRSAPSRSRTRDLGWFLEPLTKSAKDPLESKDIYKWKE